MCGRTVIYQTVSSGKTVIYQTSVPKSFRYTSIVAMRTTGLGLDELGAEFIETPGMRLQVEQVDRLVRH
jgi:hypothetical protein